MRSYKQQKRENNTAGSFLPPAVHSYKQHLAAVKCFLPDRLTQTPLDLRLSDELKKALNVDSVKPNASKTDGRLHMAVRHLRAPVLAGESVFTGAQRCVFSLPVALPVGMVADLGPQAYKMKPHRIAHSAGAASAHSKAALAHMCGDTGSLRDSSAPSFPSAIGFRDDITSCPERLDLDRRGLTSIPDLDGSEKLRLLNMQHNLISHLQDLVHLRHLVFLDLHDNRLIDMSGISALGSLRVLLLGKNRIQRICDMDGLTKLDVLDLHNNQISQIENVSGLSKLRLLNLSGNRITRVENLQGLKCLTELNLRHNGITAVTGVERLPRLQRVFLSANSISSFDALACLWDCRSLSELSVDGNPVALESCYRQTLLRCCSPHLQLLDMKRVTEEERRTASVSARKEDEKKKESHKLAAHKERRRLAIQNAAQQWEGLKACLELPAQNGSKEDVSPENSPAHSPAQTNGNTQETSPDEPRRLSPLTVSAGSDGRLRSASRPNSPRDPRLQDGGGPSVQSLSMSDSHLAELDGETLRLFGPGALETLERCWGVQTAASVTTVAFRYIHFDSIIPNFLRIRLKFPNLTHLMFMETSISHLPQLAALAQIRRLEQISVHPEGNPVVGLTLWRSFLIYRLQHLNLQKVNGTEVTMNDIMASERMFGALGHVAATETPRCRLLLLLEESRKRQLQFLLDGRGRRSGQSPEELKENGKQLGDGLSRALFNYPSRVSDGPEEDGGDATQRSAMVQQYLRGLIHRASGHSVKADALQKLWPSLFAELVRDCVLEMRDRQAFRQTSLQRLTHSK
ncbi:leucine-rich repeat-containing protein 49 isoform X1 [Megalobrama amblycephala]|uniref:leucine-rich repeat-containing protein 49 isoform X1 n=2 Tax=Megalobrama amblycephala TaxID=75352 RepID=UPI002014085B|nr:leucine-rich repeat-containing protein 49 isoform X1 [Megalobrama amblycephala]